MKLRKHLQVMILAILLLSFGCVPAAPYRNAQPPDTTGNVQAVLTPSPGMASDYPVKPTAIVGTETGTWPAPNSGFREHKFGVYHTPTGNIPTEMVGKKIIDYDRLFRYTLNSGDVLILDGGLTYEVRAELESGKTGFFILSFASEFNESMRPALNEAGIVEHIDIDAYTVYAEVPPSALAWLKTQSQNGILVWGGLYPPAGKIQPALANAIAPSPEEISEIIVRFGKIPDEELKSRIDMLFEESFWTQFESKGYHIMSGKIRNKNISQLAELPIVVDIDMAEKMKLH